MLKKLVLIVVVLLIGLQLVFADDKTDGKTMEYSEKDVKCDKLFNTCTDLKGNSITGMLIMVDKKGGQTYIRSYTDGQIDTIAKFYDDNGTMLPHDSQLAQTEGVLVFEKPYPDGTTHMKAAINLKKQEMTNSAFRKDGKKHIVVEVKGDTATGTCYLSNGKTRALTAEEIQAVKASPDAVDCK